MANEGYHEPVDVRPWSLLEPYLEGFALESVLFGTGYTGWGLVKPGGMGEQG